MYEMGHSTNMFVISHKGDQLYDKFSNLKGVKFHRGGKVVNHIENQFKRIKRIEKVRMDINKWSPADIYVTTPEYDSKCLEDEQSIRGLNQCMNERINPQDPKMFGVSLKKMSNTASLKILNFDKKLYSKFDWNAYRDYNPQNVMNIFKKVYID